MLVFVVLILLKRIADIENLVAEDNGPLKYTITYQ